MRLQFCFHLIIGFVLIILQSNAHWLQSISLFEHIKINLIFIYLVRIVLLYSLPYALTLILSAGLLLDLNSNTYFGFYTASLYVSLFVNIILYKRFDYYYSIPVFLLLVLANTFIKGLVESIIIIPFTGVISSFSYFKSTVIAETINNALFSPFIYFVMWIGNRLFNLVIQIWNLITKKTNIKSRYSYK